MPVKSAKQFRFMEAAKSGRLKGSGGPSPSVASEFLSATPESTKRSFAKENKFSSVFKKRRNQVV